MAVTSYDHDGSVMVRTQELPVHWLGSHIRKLECDWLVYYLCRILWWLPMKTLYHVPESLLYSQCYQFHPCAWNFRSEAQSKMGQHVQCYIAALAAHSTFLEQSTKSFRRSQRIKEFSERQSLNRNCLRRQNLTKDPYTRQLKSSGFFVHQPCQRQYNYWECFAFFSPEIIFVNYCETMKVRTVLGCSWVVFTESLECYNSVENHFDFSVTKCLFNVLFVAGKHIQYV